MSFLINPFTFAVAGGDFESIATTTLANSTTASVTFSSLGAYQHLQVRIMARNTRAAAANSSTMRIRLNSDSGSNYFYHRLRGDGSGTLADAGTSASEIWFFDYASNSSTANIFSVAVVDILDYSSTTKNTTVRCLTGGDFNGSGDVAIRSGAWNNTAAVTSIEFRDPSYNFLSGTTFALYGVKAP
jgi:hypothetical protein